MRHLICNQGGIIVGCLYGCGPSNIGCVVSRFHFGVCVDHLCFGRLHILLKLLGLNPKYFVCRSLSRIAQLGIGLGRLYHRLESQTLLDGLHTAAQDSTDLGCVCRLFQNASEVLVWAAGCCLIQTLDELVCAFFDGFLSGIAKDGLGGRDEGVLYLLLANRCQHLWPFAPEQGFNTTAST